MGSQYVGNHVAHLEIGDAQLAYVTCNGPPVGENAPG